MAGDFLVHSLFVDCRMEIRSYPVEPLNKGCQYGPSTWRIIPVRKQLVTPIYKLFRPLGTGITLHREPPIPMVINHLLTGMILQVRKVKNSSSSKRCNGYDAQKLKSRIRKKLRHHGFEAFLGEGSLNYPFGGNQTMQMYGNFEGFPLNSSLFGLVV